METTVPFPVPYNTVFSYYPSEVKMILENTITEIFKHTNLSSCKNLYLCEIEYDKTYNLYSFEVELQETVTYYDARCGERDVRHLNNHFKHLQSKCIQNWDCQYQHLCYCQQQYIQQMSHLGYSTIIPEQTAVQYREWLKKWQYFLDFNIVFVSCTKANYDRSGRTCVVRFKIVLQ